MVFSPMHVFLPILLGSAVAWLIGAAEHRVGMIVIVVAAFLFADEIFSAGRDRDALRERVYGMVALLGIRMLEGLSYFS
jgi:hypothetical protein